MTEWTLNYRKRRKSILETILNAEWQGYCSISEAFEACVTTLETWNLLKRWGEKCETHCDGNRPVQSFKDSTRPPEREMPRTNPSKKDKETKPSLDITPLTWLRILRAITLWTRRIAAAYCRRTVTKPAGMFRTPGFINTIWKLAPKKMLGLNRFRALITILHHIHYL